MPRVPLGPATILPPGTLAHVEADGHPIAVCNHNGTIHAFHGLCPHQNAPLGQGNLADGHIICPWHAWAFNCQSGEFEFNPAITLERYPVSVENGQIYVEVPG